MCFYLILFGYVFGFFVYLIKLYIEYVKKINFLLMIWFSGCDFLIILVIFNINICYSLMFEFWILGCGKMF